MRIEHPNYYGIAVIFNYHSCGSSMYKYLTFITCSMIYQHRTQKSIINYEYKIHNQDLEKVPHSKYLGATLSKDLSRKPHINNIIKKSNKTLGFLRRNLYSVHKK
jgi:hypothetical protein